MRPQNISEHTLCIAHGRLNSLSVPPQFVLPIRRRPLSNSSYQFVVDSCSIRPTNSSSTLPKFVLPIRRRPLQIRPTNSSSIPPKFVLPSRHQCNLGHRRVHEEQGEGDLDSKSEPISDRTNCLGRIENIDFVLCFTSQIASNTIRPIRILEQFVFAPK